ncbi:MAG TPA: hypothetical protein VGF82_16550 [Terracidiphilus sp.]|jgi:hypothetical protein
MTPQPYQNAYDTALAELNQITQKFEQLRSRKGQIEVVIQALKPFFANEAEFHPAASVRGESPIVAPARQEAGMDTEPPEGYSFRDIPNPSPDISETDGDPFQRRGKANFRFRGLATQRS